MRVEFTGPPTRARYTVRTYGPCADPVPIHVRVRVRVRVELEHARAPTQQLFVRTQSIIPEYYTQ